MNYKKIFGTILIILGIGLIFWTVLETYNIFTVQKESPKMFTIATQAISKEKEPKTLEEKMQALQLKMVTEQFEKMMPAGFMVKLLNLMAWSIGAFILFFGGGKISQIGISLLKS